MSRLSELKEKKKLDNNGFSLVELIIVIAIMAVLIGVLAPQYLKYVEKSRKSADEDNFQQIISAVQVYYSDPDHSLPAVTADTNYDITINANGAVSAVDSIIDTACKDAGVTVNNITIKSSAYKGITLRFTQKADGSTAFTVNNAELAKALAITQHS